MSFAHAIVRETLYAELSTAQRVQLHKRVGEAIEDIEGAGASDRLLDDLARHFIEAAPAGELHKAIDYARRAAHAASCQLAHEDAATLYARALELVDDQPGADAPHRMEIACQLGRARWLARPLRRGSRSRSSRSPTSPASSATPRGSPTPRSGSAWSPLPASSTSR